MNAEEALTAYGYQYRKGEYRHPLAGKERWTKTEGGWLRHDEDMPIGYQILPAFREFSGIMQGKHADAWDYVWPDEEIIKIYEEGARQNAIRAEAAAARKAPMVASGGGTGVGGGVAPEPEVDEVQERIQATIDAWEPEPVMEEPEEAPATAEDVVEEAQKKSWWKR